MLLRQQKQQQHKVLLVFVSTFTTRHYVTANWLTGLAYERSIAVSRLWRVINDVDNSISPLTTSSARFKRSSSRMRACRL